MKNWLLSGGIIIFLFLLFSFVTREKVLFTIHQSLPPVEGGMLGGILVGDKNGFEKGFYENLKNSGLVHLVVVSGSNVMLLVGGWIGSSAQLLGRKKSIVVGLVLGWWYGNLVGWEIPVVRAMMLVSVMYWAQLWGRKFNLVRGLIVSVGLMLIGEIRILISVSFWLSITAFVGIVVGRKLKIKWWWESVWVSLWITPILGLVFGKISLISPVTNFLVVGLVELITVVGVVTTMMGGLGMQLLYPALKLFVLVVELGGRFPILEFRFNWIMLVGWYIILFYFLIKNKLLNY